MCLIKEFRTNPGNRLTFQVSRIIRPKVCEEKRRGRYSTLQVQILNITGACTSVHLFLALFYMGCNGKVVNGVRVCVCNVTRDHTSC